LNAPVSTLERLAAAFSASDLTLREGACSLDAVIALGVVGASSGKGASALLRLAFDNDVTAIKAARRATIDKAKHLNATSRQGWKIARFKELIAISEAALSLYLHPTCPACRGRKFEPIPGTPALSDRACKTCHGSGRHPLPARHRREVSDLVQALTDMEQLAEAAVRLRLRGR